MRVLLSGLVGAAVSAAAWFAIEYSTHHEFGWLAIAVGLATGLCVNAAAGAAAPQSIGRAVLAVVLTLAAVVGGRMVYASVMQTLNRASTIAATQLKPNAEVSDDEEDAKVVAGDNEVASVREPLEERGGSSKSTKRLPLNRPGVNTGSAFDLVWMGVAALVAYLTGKGSGPALVQVVDPDAPTQNSSSAATSV